MSERDWLGYERREAPRASEQQLTAVHDPKQVDRVRRYSAESTPFDLDTPTSPGSWEAALRSAGGACALAEALLGGEAPTGFCATRPPGHHAEPRRAMGFCLFANAAIAARHALDSLGAERVLILDWDVHHGNGTNSIFHSSREVLFVSVHQWPFYPGTGPLEDVGSDEGEGFTINLPVPAGSGEDEWLSLVEHVALPAGRAFAPDLVLVSAGYDAHARDPVGQCRLETDSYSQLALHVRALGEELGAPVGALLEGGYDLDALAASVAATMDALAGGGEPRHVERGSRVDSAADVVGRHWPDVRG